MNAIRCENNEHRKRIMTRVIRTYGLTVERTEMTQIETFN